MSTHSSELDSSKMQGERSEERAPVRKPSRARRLAWAMAFGVLGPLLCFALQPFLPVEPFGRFEGALSLAASVGMLLLLVHLSERVRDPRASALLRGALVASSLVAFMVGLMLLPLSFIGLLVGIGVLGFMPFGTAWVLLRASHEARATAAPLQPHVRTGLAFLGAGLTLLVPIGQLLAQRLAYDVAFERVDRASTRSIEDANAALAWVPCLCEEPLVDEARWEEDETRRDQLCRLYELRFGEPLDIASLAD